MLQSQNPLKAEGAAPKSGAQGKGDTPPGFA